MEIDRYDSDKFAEDNVLSSSVVEKYKTAAEIANAVMREVIVRCSAGSHVADVCAYGDELIETATRKIFTKCDRGIAFPVCVTPNHLVQNLSPSPELAGNARYDMMLKEGDLVKIELGVQIDGYVATCAHSLVVPSPAEAQMTPVTGDRANVICAAYLTSQVVAKMLKPGVKASEVSQAIQEMATLFKCSPVTDTASYLMKRFILESNQCIKNKTEDQDKKMISAEDADESDFMFEEDQVYSVNIVMSSGTGITRTSNKYLPMVFQRDANVRYMLRLKSSKQTLRDIDSKYTVFPFSARSLFAAQPMHKMGIQECVDHGLVLPLPVFEEKSDRQQPVYVAQFKFTVLLTAKGPVMLTKFGNKANELPLPFVQSQYSIAGTPYENILKNGYQPQRVSRYTLQNAPASMDVDN